MVEKKIEGLCPCSKCGTIPKLLANAKTQFQVRCGQCGNRTKWQKKTEAVIEWFRMAICDKISE